MGQPRPQSSPCCGWAGCPWARSHSPAFSPSPQPSCKFTQPFCSFWEFFFHISLLRTLFQATVPSQQFTSILVLYVPRRGTLFCMLAAPVPLPWPPSPPGPTGTSSPCQGPEQWMHQTHPLQPLSFLCSSASLVLTGELCTQWDGLWEDAVSPQ